MPEHPAAEVPLSRQLTPEERGAQLEAFSREVEREILWDRIRTIAACFAWCAAGVAGMSVSVASTDGRSAPIIFWGSLAISFSGIMVALHGAMRREERRNGGW
jgi:fatty acid desaturase